MIDDKLTIIIKTFLRKECIEKLIISIREFYPTITINIFDDSLDDTMPNNVIGDININYIVSQFYDIGVSAGRNKLLNSVKTPYVLTLDDDFVFTELTSLDELVNSIDNSEYDIIGGLIVDNGQSVGKLLPYYGDLHLYEGTLTYIQKFDPYSSQIIECDIIPQFFIADINVLNNPQNNWDDYLKIGEHTDLFINLKDRLKTGYITSCVVLHEPITTTTYKQYRNRGKLYKKYVAKKHNIHTMIEFNNKHWSINE